MHYIAVMEDQLTVRLPRDLADALRKRAARMQRKPSEVVRMAVAEFLQLTDQPGDSPAQRVKHLIGSVESGIPDLAVRHREHILKKLRRGR
jgi:hypothetical protein